MQKQVRKVLPNKKRYRNRHKINMTCPKKVDVAIE